MNHIYYKYKPISSLNALAKALQIPLRELVWISDHAEELYNPGPTQQKNDGTIREVFNAHPKLKDLQDKINQKLLKRVNYPLYLQGGIKDRKKPRDYMRNAALHIGAKIVINEDISNFFPSINTTQIYHVWLRLFRFSPTVAECLTALTTYRGCLPQGAKTSSYLANLILWDVEPELVEQFQERNLNYSRYIDDVSVSAKFNLSSSGKQFVVGLVRSRCTRKGYKLKQNKHRIETAGKAMHVNNLVVNKKVALPRDERARIRAALHELKLLSIQCEDPQQYETKYNSLRGRICNFTRLHPKQGKKYRDDLEEIKPDKISSILQ